MCDMTESCASCPADCGRCDPCGDGFCRPEDGEDCLTCAPDCDACPRCGDGGCDVMASETCFTCPADCGICEGCGDARCSRTEDCASCATDCGVCSVCGNGMCEADEFETCANCPEDCGRCDELTCLDVITCSFGCFDFGGGGGGVPDIDLFCFSECASSACADAAFFIDQVVNCAIRVFLSGGRLPEIMEECAEELEACFRARCG
jgi:hypothetical protein